MSLYLYDSMKQNKVLFTPRNPERVTMYVCGPTVYDDPHIGNARPAVVFDVLYRLLRQQYGSNHVLYARNITDVDDKINKKAAEQGVPISTITDFYTQRYREDMAALGVMPPSLEPRATQSMDAIVSQITAILMNGHAYTAEGHVLFDVMSYRMSGVETFRDVEHLRAGARIEPTSYKRHSHDFVLWKPSKPGEPSWPSPWGNGRPGWHIECSAMIEHNLGLPIDIHGGGHDLIFPHHENEIAQGVCAQDHDCRAEYSRYWVHNGFVEMGDGKMGKSLGNAVTVRGLLTNHPGEVLRLALLSAHYRSPLKWTDSLLTQTRQRLDSMYRCLMQVKDVEILEDDNRTHHFSYMPHFLRVLSDDMNTPLALSHFPHMVQKVLEAKSATEKVNAKTDLIRAGYFLGILQAKPGEWFREGVTEQLSTLVDNLIAQRADARQAKNWEASDAIRDQLNALNVEVSDGPSGATWRVRA